MVDYHDIDVNEELVEVENPTERCCKTVYPSDGGYSAFKGHQCSRKGKFLYHGKYYCKQHHPITQKLRDIGWNQKYARERAERQHRVTANNHRNTAIDIVRKIARGDNDPRTTAQEFLDELQRLVDLPIEHYIRKD